MLYLRILNNALNNIPEQASKIALYNDIKRFLKLMANSKDIAKHHRSIQISMKEQFNITKNLLPITLDDFLIKDY